jgi:recombination protein RecA
VKPALSTVAELEAPAGFRRGLEAASAVDWKLATFQGRLTEVSGSRSSASLTLVFRLVLEAQLAAEPVAWVGCRQSCFYPPDAAATGVDLNSLAVVWATGTRQAACVSDILIRSGGFGLVLLDAGRDGQFPIAFQSRLAGLAKKHEAALICLTEKESRQPSLGSLVSLRAEAVRGERDGDRFRCEGRVLKDKRRGPGWMHVEICRGPDGLC